MTVAAWRSVALVHKEMLCVALRLCSLMELLIHLLQMVARLGQDLFQYVPANQVCSPCDKQLGYLEASM